MTASPSSAAQTTIQNGSFDANLNGWTNQSDPSFNISWAPSGNTAAGGAAKVTWVGPTEHRQFVPLTQSGIAVTPGVTYEYGASVKLAVDPSRTGDDPVSVRVLFYGEGAAIPLLGAYDQFFGSGWGSLRGVVVAPLGATTLAIELAMPGTAGRWPNREDTQIAMFDDVFVRALPTDAAFLTGMAKYVVSPDPNVHLDRGGPSTTVAAADGAVLNWATSSAQSVSITPGIGSVAPTGSRVVHPAQTTTYTLTVSGPFGSVVKQVTVNVTP